MSEEDKKRVYNRLLLAKDAVENKLIFDRSKFDQDFCHLVDELVGAADEAVDFIFDCHSVEVEQLKKENRQLQEQIERARRELY